MIQQLITERLIIIPMTHSMIRSVLNSDNDMYDNLGIISNGKWPLPDTMDILHFIKDNMNKNDEVSGFDVWMIVKKDGMNVIGDAGFKGEPNEAGEIEIGFGLIPEEHQKGYGYELASALMDWAAQQSEVKVIKAECLLDNTGSIKLLQKCGMSEVSRDSELIYWEKSLDK